jgi:autotransporter-associated beta strand protein
LLKARLLQSAGRSALQTALTALAATALLMRADGAVAQTFGADSTTKISTIGSSATPSFNGGTLQIDKPGTYANNFTLQSAAASAIDATGNSAVFSGIFSDYTSGTAGYLTITDSTGGGLITFSGVNTFTGSTTINSGASLALTGSGSLAASSGISNNGVFDISGTSSGASIVSLSGSGTVLLGGQNLTLTSASGIFSGVISGAGQLIVNGGGETLGGANTYSGGTVINGGTLTVGDGTSNGWIIGNVSTAGTLTFARADAVTFDGLISGSGGLSQAGSSTLTLTAANTYTGTTNVAAGVLALAGSNTIASSSHVTVTGTLDVTAAGASLKSLAGAGTVQLGGQTLTLTSASDTFSGVITGTGNVVLLSGTETFTGANTYSGSTVVSGGILRLGQTAVANAITNNATVSFFSTGPIAMTGVISGSGTVTQTGSGTTTISTAQTYTGATIVSAGTLALVAGGSILSSSGLTVDGTFDISAVTGGASIVSLTGVGNVQLGTQTLTLTNASGTFAGNIAGSGDMVLASGKQTLSGASTFTGVTTITSGTTLYLTSSSALSGSRNVVDNGNLDISGVTSSGIVATTSITSLSGSGTVTLGSKTLILTNADGAFSGTISGAGGVTVSAGTQTLTGVNSYTGATTITGGILALSGAGRVGASSTVQADGIFDISAANGGVAIGSLSGAGTVNLGANSLSLGLASTIFSGAITGSGALTVSGGTQILNGTSNYTGGTTISAGTLQIGNGFTSGSILGDIVDNGTLVFNRSGTATFAGAVSGTGALVQNGGGTTVLTGTNTYSGGTTITIGTLQIGNGSTTGTITGDVANSGTLAFNRSDAVTFGGSISGTGGLTQAGTGALTLTGVSTYYGATTINAASTLVLASSASIANSNVLDNGTLDVSAATTPRIASLGGNGTVNLGTQTLQLAAASDTFSGSIAGSGGLIISGGTQTLTGVNSYTGLTRVTGGALAGTGTVASVAVDTGGTLAPGVAGSGTLKINGALTMASGSNYLVNVSSTSAPSLSVAGTGALDGTLSVRSSDGGYLLGQKVTVLTAAGGISGSFAVAPIQSTGAQFASAVSYDANNVYLQINLAKLSPLLPSTATANQARIVGGIDGAIAAGDTVPVSIQRLGNLTSDGLAADADQLSGEIGADVPRAGNALFNPFMDAIFDHLVDIDQSGKRNGRQPAQRNLWLSGFAGSDLASGDTDAGSHKFKDHVSGFAGGADWMVSPNFRLGVAMSAGSSNFHLANDLGLGSIDGYQAGAYGLLRFGSVLYGAFSGALALDDITTNRILTVAGSDQLTAKATAFMMGGRFETGLKLGFVRPYLAFRDQLLSVPAYNETASSGSSTFALSYTARNTNTADVELGIRQATDVPLGRFWTVRFSDQLGWAHDLSGTMSANPQFVSLASSGFTVDGVRVGKDTAVISLGALFRNRKGLGFDLHFNGQSSAASQSYTGVVGLNYTW